ncbi:MAG: choice-of-anchor J domain-containing protein [Methylococcales bacterium]
MKVYKYLSLLLLFSANVDATVLLNENFDDVNALQSKGWDLINNSSASTEDWFQGTAGIFSAHSGAEDSYAAASAANSDLDGGNASNWLVSPSLNLNNGDQLKFYVRADSAEVDFHDRLQVRLSDKGQSKNVGVTDTSVGDFGTLLIDITSVSPEWALETVTLSGLGAPINGRIGFRYLVTDTDNNGNYIGIDTLSVMTPVPAPGTFYFLGSGLLYLLRRKFVWSA